MDILVFAQSNIAAIANQRKILAAQLAMLDARSVALQNILTMVKVMKPDDLVALQKSLDDANVTLILS